MNGNHFVSQRTISMLFAGFIATAHAATGLSAIAVSPGDTLNDQYFAWESSYSSRRAGDYASYSIRMTAGVVYTITTSNAHGGNSSDTYLYLIDAGGGVAASDDDSGPGRLSKMVYRSPGDGDYIIKLRAYRRGRYGYCTLAISSNGQGTTGAPLYPDLITWRDYLRNAEIITSNGEKLLRFSNSAVNIGQGPLEVYGVVQRDGTTFAYQRVHNDNGTYSDRLAGTFVFAGHESHSHWHFDDFADYSLRGVAADGGVGDVVASSEKVSFCLEDTLAYDRSLPGAPGGEVYTCDNQGISVGWGDLYKRDLAGQNIRITAVPDGTYWLESVADPRNRLVELDDSNNAALLKIRIDKTSNSVTIIE